MIGGLLPYGLASVLNRDKLAISPKYGAIIDRKIDDGGKMTGRVRAYCTNWPADFYPEAETDLNCLLFLTLL